MRGSVTEAPFYSKAAEPGSGRHPVPRGWNQGINPTEAWEAVLKHLTPFNLSATKKSLITTQMIAQNKAEYKERRIMYCRGKSTGLERKQLGSEKGKIEMGWRVRLWGPPKKPRAHIWMQETPSSLKQGWLCWSLTRWAETSWLLLHCMALSQWRNYPWPWVPHPEYDWQARWWWWWLGR